MTASDAEAEPAAPSAEVPYPGQARRHGAVAFADIVGYTILASTDGERTHARWMRALFGTLQPLARAHGATIVKSTGDGVVVDFPDADHAFAWARAILEATREPPDSTLPPMTFRVAIHEGPMWFTEEGIYGETVNIAARLENHAPPGGVIVSETALGSLTLPPPMQDLGVLSLRNIAVPVRAFALGPAAPVRVPTRSSSLGVPSLAVMPFENLSQDPANLYFADGIIEDLVLSLGALRELSVISRAAMLSWQGGRHDPRVIGRVLNVRYLLSGSVRRAGGGLRLTAVLHESEEGDAVWSERFDVNEAELFDVQDEIVARAVAGIAPSVRAAELRRAMRQKPNSLTAYDHTLRGIHNLDELRRETFGLAGDELRRAVSEDPAFAMPLAWAALWHSFAVGQAWSASPEQDAERVRDQAARAIQLDPANALAHAMTGHHRAYHMHDPEHALPHFERALQACPNHALSLTWKSASLSYLGRGAEALPFAERALLLCPHGPERYYFECFVGIAHLAAGDPQAAERWMQLSLIDNPQFNSAHRFLIASLHAQGKKDEARAVAGDLLANDPDFRVSTYARTRQPFVDEALRRAMLTALREAGAPE